MTTNILQLTNNKNKTTRALNQMINAGYILFKAANILAEARKRSETVEQARLIPGRS